MESVCNKSALTAVMGNEAISSVTEVQVSWVAVVVVAAVVAVIKDENPNRFGFVVVVLGKKELVKPTKRKSVNNCNLFNMVANVLCVSLLERKSSMVGIHRLRKKNKDQTILCN